MIGLRSWVSHSQKMQSLQLERLSGLRQSAFLTLSTSMHPTHRRWMPCPSGFGGMEIAGSAAIACLLEHHHKQAPGADAGG
jgi:hypothetical protein